jgi:hypothetical protein
MLASFGINATAIVEKNKGNLKATVIEFANALNTLDPLSRARAIEQMFGKFQFARLSTLFANVARDGNQAARVLDLANASVEELSALSEQELGMTAESSMNKFRKSVEDLKIALVPVGQAFLEAATPIIDFVGGVLEKFANLSDGTKRLITLLTVGLGAVGPVLLMTFGLLANGIANIIKLFLTLRGGYQRLTGQSQILGEQTQYMTMEQLDAAAAAHSLNQTHANLIQTFTAEVGQINKLIAAYNSAAGAARNFAMTNPGMMMPGRAVRKLASGIVSVPGPKGAGDIVPAMLSPGEAVIPAKFVEKYGPLIQGMVAGNIPGYMAGKDIAFAHAAMPFEIKSSQFQQGIKIAGLEKLASEFPHFIKVVSNLVTELPQSLNVAMKKGVGIGEFSREYGARTGKFATAAKLGGLDITDTNAAIALQKLENEIGETTITLAKQQSVGGKVIVSDELLAKATRSVIDKYKTIEGSAGNAARALDNASKQIGQIRISAKKEDIVTGLKSGRFRKTRTASQTQNQIMFDNINIARESVSSPGQFQSGNPKSPRGTYRGKQKRSILINQSRQNVDDIIFATAQAAGTKSPSRKTIPIGQDIARGLEVGMKNRQKNVAQAGTNLSAAAIGGTKNIPFQAAGQSATIPQIAENIPVDPTLISSKQRPRGIRRINPMKANMGLMGVGMAASMLPGKAGDVAMKVSGLAFVAQALMALPGPLKLVAVAFGGLYGITKLLNAAKEKERQAIEGVGKAANLSASQIEKLGGVLGFTPIKSNLEQSKGAISGITVQKSQQIEETRKLLAEDPEFKNQVSTLKDATNQQADIIFKSLALRLTGQGATKEQITNYIYALQLEAGKTDVKLDLKSIDLSTKEGQAGLQTSIDTLLKDYKNAFDKGYKKTKIFVGGGRGGVVTKEVEILSNDLKKQLSTTANVISNTFMSLDTQLRSGKINADQFNQSFDNISKSINEMPKAEGLFLMGELLKILPSELAKSASGLKNTADQLLIIKSAALGVAVTAEMIQALTIAETDKSADAQIRAAAVRSDLENAMKKAQKVIAEIIKQNKIGTGGTKKEDPRDVANKNLSTISNFFNAQEALLRQNRKLKEDALQAEVDLAETAVKSAEERIDAEQKLIDTNQRSIDLLNRRIELEFERPIQKLQDESTILNNNLEIIRNQEDAINSQYDRQLEALDKISSKNQEIANQEKSRLDIASALTSGDVAAAAQAVQEARAQAAVSQLEKQRTGLEASRQQALSGVTAGGMTKDQIEARTYQIGQQTFALEQQRKIVQNEITTLQDKNYNLEQGIYSIKQNSLIPAQQNVDKAKLALEEYNKQTDSLVNSITYLEKTQTEWTNVETRVKAANAAIDLTKIGLTKASDITKDIFKNWDAIKDKTITITTNYVSGTSGASGYLNPTVQTNTYKAKMYGGKIKNYAGGGIVKVPIPEPAPVQRMNMGGIVPKYFARGGRMGSDSVPAMLTPGEFVMNRRATEQFGPLLSMLNESKYPSMIGPSYSGRGMSGNKTSINNNSRNVYNYSVDVNVAGTNASPNAVAKAVMDEIRYLDSQRVRGQRVS